MLAPRYSAAGRVFSHIVQYHPELTAFRRDLHAHPELGYEEVYTSSRIAKALELCGVDEIHTGIGKTGVVGVIRGRQDSSGRMIGLRADMDALPINEGSDCEWKSTQSGLMHACGHDGHVAMLVGAARYLAATRQFDGTAVLIFQPGEEGYAGARAMIEDGLFERFAVQSVYAMHTWPAMREGTIGLNSGPMMAAADRIRIDLVGKGGHGAHPYQTNDVLLASAHLITAIQTIVSRNVRALDSAVISLCAMEAGDMGAFSVTPGSAAMVGTVRSFNVEVQSLIERRLHELCQSMGQAFGVTATLQYERMYPATINTVPEARFAGDVAQLLVGADNVVRDLVPSMGAEDFSFMLQQRPGAYLRLGQSTGEGFHPLHSSQFDFNDNVLPLGAALHASLVERGMPLAQSMQADSSAGDKG